MENLSIRRSYEIYVSITCGSHTWIKLTILPIGLRKLWKCVKVEYHSNELLEKVLKIYYLNGIC